MRSFLLRLAALVLAVSGFAACGDDPTTDAGDTTTSGDGGTTARDATTTTQAATTSSTGEGSTTTGPIGGPYPLAELTIVVTHPDEDDVTYTISCLGDTASITGDPVAVDEQAACLALAEPAVVERLTTDPGQRICTQQYGGPDEASVTGTIDDASVDATIDRKDGCGIDDWDDTLADVLPAAVGLR